MRLIEYRILMPMTVEQNQVGQIWSFAEVSRLNTGGGEGVEILKNELFALPADHQSRDFKTLLPEYVDYDTQKQQYNAERAASSAGGRGGGSFSTISSLMSFRSKGSKASSKAAAAAAASSATTAEGHQRSSSLRKTAVETSSMTHSKSMDIRSMNKIGSDAAKKSAVPMIVDSSTSNVTVSMSNISFELGGKEEEEDDEEAQPIPLTTTTTTTTTNNNNSNKKPQQDGGPTGQYTHKIYKMTSKLPWFLRKILPKATTEIVEKSWNVYPRVKTVLTNEFFINCARIELDTVTRACPDDPDAPLYDENAHGLSAEQLEAREVIYVDIAEPVSPGYYKADEDPALCRSEKAGLGPLAKGWYERQRPLICCYKLVTADFKVFGLQSHAEGYLRNMYRDLFAVFHRQVFCWMDKWHELSLEEVRELERRLAAELKDKINKGELSKNVLQQES